MVQREGDQPQEGRCGELEQARERSVRSPPSLQMGLFAAACRSEGDQSGDDTHVAVMTGCCQQKERVRVNACHINARSEACHFSATDTQAAAESVYAAQCRATPAT